jgi:hypothetical protein
LGEYHAIAHRLTAAFAPYDVVIGYTVSAIFAAAIKHKAYFAYELGTLRGLPYEDSPTGRMTKWLYQNAPAVFITNIDCLDHAKSLGIAKEKSYAALHAYDIKLMTAPVDVNSDTIFRLLPDLRPDKPMIFAPARHHWSQGNDSWLKGNNLYIRALGILKRQGYTFSLVTVDWGQEVNLSKQLIKEEGLFNDVIWIRPQSRPIMKALYERCVCVIDQFNAKALGGVALDAMVCAKRLLTSFDKQNSLQFFTTHAPLKSYDTLDDIVAGLKDILNDLDDKDAEGLALRSWVVRENGEARQLSIILDAVRDLLKTDSNDKT